MVKTYKIPLNPTKNPAPGPDVKNEEADDESKYEAFTIDQTLKYLALNKHNDHTSTYYLLHKKWMLAIDKKNNLKGTKFDLQESCNREAENLITLTPANYQ